MSKEVCAGLYSSHRVNTLSEEFCLMVCSQSCLVAPVSSPRTVEMKLSIAGFVRRQGRLSKA